MPRKQAAQQQPSGQATNTTPVKSPSKRSSTPKKLPPAVTPDAALLDKAARIAAQLQTLYPDPPIPLSHTSSFQLLVAVMLSAQTTDKKVNASAGRQAHCQPPSSLNTHTNLPFSPSASHLLLLLLPPTQVNEVTPQLFALAPDAAAMAAQEVAAVQTIIQPIGLAPTKAKNLVSMSQVCVGVQQLYMQRRQLNISAC